MTTSVTIDSDVIDHVGLDQAAEFQSRVTVFECVECGTAGDARTEPAVVVLRRSPGLSHLGVAHHRCADSQVRDYGPGDLALTGETDLVPRVLGLPSPTGTRPVLLLAYEEEVVVTEDGGPSYDPVIRSLLGDGLHQIPVLGKPSPRSPGWRALIGPGTNVQVSSSARTWLTDGDMYVPPGWRALAEQAGEVTLMMGRLEHTFLHAATPPLMAYAKAARQGYLVAGVVDVVLR
ncbi:hypothetical protein EES39_40325 [Streptomyces sp. ADI92-24]|uniref:hypothetical protein n=1 Tax=Streptomyces sp. ADI92-24 TaxID=1522756 RepID=UPI000F5593FC|nr:hypothetical protein [Streptomyces sp. ADI92-24]RPK29193.1 hypothetical protein EES39_40325 [Streptomyces sp. ADI92-24]